MNAGICAEGFGVCCILTIGCGGRTNENNTYFTSQGSFGNGPVLNEDCSATICKCDSSICQLRLDFLTFNLAGPSSNTVTIGRILNRVLINDPMGTSTVPITGSTRCLTDRFQATSPGGISPPVICGQNSGEHMYIDASDNCNDLGVTLGSDINTNWVIQVSQFRCDFINLAPSGCTQWFYGGVNGIVRTYNFNGGLHLAEQNQNICVRREKNTCEICWYAGAPADFQLSGIGDAAAGNGQGITDGNICCAYGIDGLNEDGFDCLIFAAPVSDPDLGFLLAMEQCGRSNGLVFAGQKTVLGSTVTVGPGSLDRTLCSKSAPFSIRFLSDNYEFAQEANKVGMMRGFELQYSLQNC